MLNGWTDIHSVVSDGRLVEEAEKWLRCNNNGRGCSNNDSDHNDDNEMCVLFSFTFATCTGGLTTEGLIRRGSNASRSGDTLSVAIRGAGIE